MAIIRRMYEWRLGEILPEDDLDALRGIEGARSKASYKKIAHQFGVRWEGRNYDRSDPEGTDLPNQAINHSSTAILGLAQLAVAVSGTIPQLGFIHEDSGYSFALDVADIYRDSITIPVAFGAIKAMEDGQVSPDETVERTVRRMAGKRFRKDKIVSNMIDKIKELFDADDCGRAQ